MPLKLFPYKRDDQNGEKVRNHKNHNIYLYRRSFYHTVFIIPTVPPETKTPQTTNVNCHLPFSPFTLLLCKNGSTSLPSFVAPIQPLTDEERVIDLFESNCHRLDFSSYRINNPNGIERKVAKPCLNETIRQYAELVKTDPIKKKNKTLSFSFYLAPISAHKKDVVFQEKERFATVVSDNKKRILLPNETHNVHSFYNTVEKESFLKTCHSIFSNEVLSKQKGSVLPCDALEEERRQHGVSPCEVTYRQQEKRDFIKINFSLLNENHQREEGWMEDLFFILTQQKSSVRESPFFSEVLNDNNNNNSVLALLTRFVVPQTKKDSLCLSHRMETNKITLYNKSLNALLEKNFLELDEEFSIPCQNHNNNINHKGRCPSVKRIIEFSKESSVEEESPSLKRKKLDNHQKNEKEHSFVEGQGTLFSFSQSPNQNSNILSEKNMNIYRNGQKKEKPVSSLLCIEESPSQQDHNKTTERVKFDILLNHNNNEMEKRFLASDLWEYNNNNNNENDVSFALQYMLYPNVLFPLRLKTKNILQNNNNNNSKFTLHLNENCIFTELEETLSTEPFTCFPPSHQALYEHRFIYQHNDTNRPDKGNTINEKDDNIFFYSLKNYAKDAIFSTEKESNLVPQTIPFLTNTINHLERTFSELISKKNLFCVENSIFIPSLDAHRITPPNMESLLQFNKMINKNRKNGNLNHFIQDGLKREFFIHFYTFCYHFFDLSEIQSIQQINNNNNINHNHHDVTEKCVFHPFQRYGWEERYVEEQTVQRVRRTLRHWGAYSRTVFPYHFENNNNNNTILQFPYGIAEREEKYAIWRVIVNDLLSLPYSLEKEWQTPFVILQKLNRPQNIKTVFSVEEEMHFLVQVDLKRKWEKAFLFYQNEKESHETVLMHGTHHKKRQREEEEEQTHRTTDSVVDGHILNILRTEDAQMIKYFYFSQLESIQRFIHQRHGLSVFPSEENTVKENLKEKETINTIYLV